MEKLKKIVTYGLLGFALISIGFALGKHSVKPTAPALPLPESGVNADSGTVPDAEDQLVVYYLHGTFRCVTCNTIEKMARELVETDYAAELADHRIRWMEADFQEDKALARQFEVVSSCVVVANLKNDAIADYQRLDEVWTLMSEPEAFNRYIRDAIDQYLKRTEAE